MAQVTPSQIDNTPGHGSQTLKNADEEVRVAEEFSISKTILLPVTRLAEEEICFWPLIHKGERGKNISYDTDDNHLNAAQGLWKA